MIYVANVQQKEEGGVSKFLHIVIKKQQFDVKNDTEYASEYLQKEIACQLVS